MCRAEISVSVGISGCPALPWARTACASTPFPLLSSLLSVLLTFPSTGSIEVCRQCMECGVRHGQRKRTRDIVTWLKKKRRLIRRDELLAFLLDKPYSPDSFPSCDRSEDLAQLQPSFSHIPPHHHTYPKPLQPPPIMAGLSYTPPMPMSLPVSSNSCFGPLPNPRGKWALFGREDQSLHSDSELYATRENGRKRLNCSSAGPFEFSQESPPVAKRMKI